MASWALSMATGSQRMRQNLFGNLRVRYGIKMGLAGLLALFCTQVLRLPHDNWAILTVVVLMSAQFVGSIAFKAIMPSDRNDRRSVRGSLVGRRLYFYASDLFAGPFPGHGFCQLQVRPTRSTPGPICLLFARFYRAYHRYRWGHGSGTGVADRPRPNRGDFGRNYELAYGNEHPLVGRLIWPVLPQRVLQDNLLTLFAQIGALLSGDSHWEKIQTQLAILPVEALQAARQIRIAGC